MANKNYLAIYAKKATPMFQAGGEMGGEMGADPAMAQEAPAPQGPDVEGMLQEYSQSGDPQLAVQICDTLVAMMAQGQGGGGQTPAMRNGGRMNTSAPIFKAGGRLKI